MKKIQYLAAVCLLAGTVSLYAQTPAKGDVAKGKTSFDQQCGVCHDAMSTDKKMGPGLKGLYKRPKLANGKPVNDSNVLDQINTGGNGMPPYKDMLSDVDRANIVAYLKAI